MDGWMDDQAPDHAQKVKVKLTIRYTYSILLTIDFIIDYFELNN